MSELQPKIEKQIIGVRKLREITIFPMSVQDQLEMTDVITEAIQGIVSTGVDFQSINDIAVVGVLVKVVRDNATKMLSLITDQAELRGGVSKDATTKKKKKKFTVLSELTNEQLTEIADKIWTMNYEGPLKNWKGLIDRVKELTSMRQSPPSVSVMDTVSQTSSGDFETEALQ